MPMCDVHSYDVLCTQTLVKKIHEPQKSKSAKKNYKFLPLIIWFFFKEGPEFFVTLHVNMLRLTVTIDDLGKVLNLFAFYSIG